MGDAAVHAHGGRVAATTGVLDRVVIDGGRVGLSATACARVTDPEGTVVGSGFLVAPGLVATCAHVVASALGADPAGPAPAGPVAVDLPLLGALAVRGTVVRWLAVGDDGHGDVALLRLRADLPGAVVPPARGPRDLWDRAFRTFGFPEGREDGVWATGVLRAGQATGWIQLQTTPGDQRIGPGFSGAPVWDAATGAVVGMTVAADREDGSTTAYLVPIADVLGLDPELAPCPYRGVEPFGEEHAPLFHGRDADVTRLLAAVAAAPLVMVIGPSGSGKSSLVAAGLVPRLRDGGTPAVVLRADPDPPGPAQLAGAVLALTDPAADAGRRDRDAARIGAALSSAAGRDAALGELAAALSGRPRCVIVIDQFEELVETAPDQARTSLDIVARLASPSLCVVVTLRAAALDDVLGPDRADRAAALTATAATVLVGPLERAQLREVVTGPARQPPGLDFEDGLVDRILDDVPPGAGQLPLLESLLARLWAERVGGTLTGAAYACAGGVAGALAARAEDAVAAAEPAAARHLPDLLRRLTGLDRHGRALRRRVPYLELPDGPRELVALLAAHRVVVVTGHGERSTVELAHAALTDQWPRLHDLVADDRDFLRWRTELDLARHRWEDGGRDPDALLRGSALAAADAWTPRAGEVAAADRAFLAAGRDRRRRERRRRRIGVAVLAVAALVAALLAVTVVRARGQIDVQAAAAAARALAQAATDHQGTDPLLAAELALAAYHAGPDDPAARTALVHQYQALSDVVGVLPDTGSAPQALRAPATGTAALLAAGRAAGPELALFGDPAGAAAVRRVVPAGAYKDAALSPDGRRFAALRTDGGVDVIDDSPTGSPRPVVSAGSAARTVQFSADSRLLGWLSGDVPHAVWHVLDAGSGAVVVDRPLPGAVTAVPVDRDGLAAVGADGGVTLVDTRTGTALRTFPGTTLDGTGTRTLRCADEGGDTVLHTTTILTGAERALSIGLEGDCDRYLTAGEWVLTDSVTLDAGVSWRATSLADGAARWFVTPPMTDDPDTRKLGPIALTRTGDEVVAFAAVGPRVLRLRTRPDPVPAGASSPPRFEDLSDDGQWLVVRDGDTVRTFAAGGGTAVSTVPHPAGGGGGGVAGSRLWWVENPAGAGPNLTGYDLPDLTRQVTVPFAPGSWKSGTTTVFGEGPDRTAVTLVSLDRGELTVNDARTGAPAGARSALAASPADTAWFNGHAVLAARRGQPDQVLVGMPDGHLALWDARAGRHLLDLPVPDGPGDLVAAAAGDRAATISETNIVRVWDLVSGRETRTIPVPGVVQVVGFTADGTLIVIVNTDQLITRLLAIDVASGAVITTFPGDLFTGLGRIAAGDRLVVPTVDRASGPRIVPLDPRQWRDVLCRLLPPDPSPALATMLPPGTPPGAPCGP